MVADWTMAEMIEHDRALTPCRFFPFSPICKRHHRVSKPGAFGNWRMPYRRSFRMATTVGPKGVRNGD